MPESAAFDPVRQYISDFNMGRTESIAAGEGGNIFEICNISTRETSISSVLAFFLDPGEVHGFGDLFLKSLLECIECGFSVDEVEFSDIEVETERFIKGETEGGRADIWIEGSIEDKHFAIIIENKIYASENNPFEEIYNKFLKDVNNEYSAFCKTILLSPFKGNQDDKFIRLLYSTWFEKIRNNPRIHGPEANGKYFYLAQDLFKSMDKIMKNTDISALGSVLGDKYEDMLKVLRLTEIIFNFRKEAKNLTKILHDATWIKLNNDSDDRIKKTVKVGLWGAPYYPGYNMVFSIFPPNKHNKKKIIVDVWCMNNGWNVVIFTNQQSSTLSPFLNKIINNDSRFIVLEIYGQRRICLNETKPLHTPMPDVVEWVYNEMRLVVDYLYDSNTET